MASSNGSSPVYTTAPGDYAGNNPVNPYDVGDTSQLAQFVDTSIKFGDLGGDTLVVRPPA